jgi:molecular chaperone GrpE
MNERVHHGAAPAAAPPDAPAAAPSDGAAAAGPVEQRSAAELADALQAGELALGEAQAQRDDYLDRLRRLAAEFDNYKKRQARDREQERLQANERIVRDLLPVLDDLERAIDAFDEHEPDSVREGVVLVHRALRTLLEREGISEIAPEGERFDPHEHEALTAQAVPGVSEGTVLQVVQRGFRLGERVVRPARVVIAAEPPAAE